MKLNQKRVLAEHLIIVCDVTVFKIDKIRCVIIINLRDMFSITEILTSYDDASSI
jgi:hypothetical protein